VLGLKFYDIIGFGIKRKQDRKNLLSIKKGSVAVH
jgi:hypothetical protein